MGNAMDRGDRDTGFDVIKLYFREITSGDVKWQRTGVTGSDTRTFGFHNGRYSEHYSLDCGKNWLLD
jgi:hypothetical protein